MQALLSDVIVLPDRLLLKQAHVEKDVVESGIPMWSWPWYTGCSL